MTFKKIIYVANPSPYERSDYVEIDLESFGIPEHLDSRNLRVTRHRPKMPPEEIPYQIDYPFGREVGYRVMTLFSAETPAGNADYEHPSAEFLLQESEPRAVENFVPSSVLDIQHYSGLNTYEKWWDPNRRISGVKLFSGRRLPDGGRDPENMGLEVYFSLVPRPEATSPVNYSGAATNIHHHQAGCEALAPWSPWWREYAPEKRWGQLTRIDLYPFPWERRWYHTRSLLEQTGQEPNYTLAWSQVGSLRATVTLKSKSLTVEYGGAPFLSPGTKEITCSLYRIISFYARKNFYTEQLVLRPEGDEAAAMGKRISLAFRAHYYSYLDCPSQAATELARFEHIPDYFAIWKHWGVQHHGYAFASDSHVRQVKCDGPHVEWRLQLGHEHRCIHLFPFHGYLESVRPFDEIGHTGWYEWVFKPLRAIPLDLYMAL